MFSVGYFIVCINLLYYFDQAETCSPLKTKKVQKDEQAIFSSSLNVENKDLYLVKMITPYWNMTYNEELNKKQTYCRVIVEKIFKWSKNLKNPQIHRFFKIVPSPVTRAYRNQDKFNIGVGVDGNPKTVGLAVRNTSIGKKLVFHPSKISTIKESHKRVAQVYEDFVRLSPLSANVEQSDGGHWRTLFVRSSEAGKIMATITVQPKGYTIETIQEHQLALKDYFLKHLPHVSLFHQQCPFMRCNFDDFPIILLYGTPYFMEYLNGYKFKITPKSFFPTNNLGAKVMYDTIIEKAELKSSTIVLDFCRHTGTTSVMVSRYVREAILLAPMQQTVTDTRYIASLNKIHNIKILPGNIDDKLKSVFKNVSASNDILAIVNPISTRIGLSHIKTILNYPKISRLMYISSKITGRIPAEIFDLLWSQFPPFRLTKVIPIDLFPQTSNVEIVLTFQR